MEASAVAQNWLLSVVTVTGWVVLVDLLEGIHGNFGPRGQEGHATTDYSIHVEVVVVVNAATCLDD